MTNKIRYGVIGTGMMGIEHIENLAAIDDAVVVAVADSNARSLEQGMAATSGTATAFSSHHALIDSGLCDAVVLVTPNYTHHEILLDLLATDLHVLTEKPMCTTTEACKEIVAAASSRAALTWVGLEYRYMPPVSRLIDEVHSGAVGAPQMVAIREHRFPFLDKVDNWNRLNRNTGGTLVEKCCHYFDLMNVLVQDRPISVVASGGQNVNHLDEAVDGEPSDILDNAFVIVEYPGGVRASLDLCMFAEATRNQEELSVVGDLGKAEALIPDNVVRLGRRGDHFIGGVDEHEIRNDEIRVAGYHHGSSWLEHRDFAYAIASGTPAKVTPVDGLWSVAMGEAAHRSIEERRIVDLSELIGDDELFDR